MTRQKVESWCFFYEIENNRISEEFPNLLKYMYGGGLTLNRSSAPGLLGAGWHASLSRVQTIFLRKQHSKTAC
jgi:hypothetical protein